MIGATERIQHAINSVATPAQAANGKANLRLSRKTAVTPAIVANNTTVAIAVATSVDDTLAGPAAVYGLFAFVTAGLFARLMARRNAVTEPAIVAA